MSGDLIEEGAEAEDVDVEKEILDDGSVLLTLQFPVKVTLKRDGVERLELIEKISIRRMRGDDLEAAHKIKDEMQAAILIFTRLTGQPNLVFRAMDAKDINAFNNIVEGFTPKSRKTGPT